MLRRQVMSPETGNDTQAPMLLGLTGGLLFLCILLLCARFWSRLRNLKADDWTVLGGTILAIVNCFIASLACTHGFGRRTAFVSPANRLAALRLIFILQVVFYWSVTLVKLSVALLLLRLRPTRRWKIFLYSTMTILVMAVIMQTAFQFLQCRPFTIYWDPSMAKIVKCIPLRVINTNIIANSTIHVTTDLVFSFVPITFIRKLNRPRSEKIFLSILMGLGLFASTFAVLRTSLLGKFNKEQDFFRMNVMPTLWASLELEFALVAATIPTLRNFLHRVLVRLGTYFYEEESETEIRSKLAELGFLSSGEATNSDVTGRKMSNPDIDVARFQSPKLGKKMDEFGDTLVEEREVVMVTVSRLGKDVDFEMVSGKRR